MLKLLLYSEKTFQGKTAESPRDGASDGPSTGMWLRNSVLWILNEIGSKQ
jgi:hypothetical protein